MAKIESPYADARTIPADDASATVATFVLTKVIRQVVPLVNQAHGNTLGQTLDMLLSNAMAGGEEVQTIELEITPERWRDMVNAQAFLVSA